MSWKKYSNANYSKKIITNLFLNLESFFLDELRHQGFFFRFSNNNLMDSINDIFPTPYKTFSGIPKLMKTRCYRNDKIYNY